jgi:DNA-binding MarR family transcriptional regulator
LVSGILLTWVLSKERKTIMPKQSKRDRTKDLAEELDVFDTMLSALVEILEKKGIVTQEEWEERIKMKTIKAGGTNSYRDIQFSSKP